MDTYLSPSIKVPGFGRRKKCRRSFEHDLTSISGIGSLKLPVESSARREVELIGVGAPSAECSRRALKKVDVARPPLPWVADRIVGTQVDLLVLGRAPRPIDEQPALAIHADGRAALVQRSVNASLVNWLPCLVLTISGLACRANTSSSVAR